MKCLRQGKQCLLLRLWQSAPSNHFHSGFNHEDRWGHRAGEPNKAVVCSIALARLRNSVRGTDQSSINAMNMSQKLLLFWRKPARRCWWEGVELDNVEGVQGKLKVWVRRVWTLEMVSAKSKANAKFEQMLNSVTECHWTSVISKIGHYRAYWLLFTDTS